MHPVHKTTHKNATLAHMHVEITVHECPLVLCAKCYGGHNYGNVNASNRVFTY